MLTPTSRKLRDLRASSAARAEALASRHAGRLVQSLSRCINARKLVQRWIAVNEVPQRETDGDAESFLMALAAGAFENALGTVLEGPQQGSTRGLWAEAWLLGALSGWRMTQSASPAVKSSDGDSYTQCDAGHEHWGKYGAAGLLIRHGSDPEKRSYLLQLNAGGSAKGTWGTPGGAIGSKETTLTGALREAHEELGELPPLTHRHAVVDDHGGWSYTTHVMDASKKFKPAVDGSTPGEVAGWGWFTADEAETLPLHPGFETTWPVVRDSTEDTVTGPATGAKAWKWPHIPGTKPAPLSVDPWLAERDRIARSGIPRPLAGMLSSAYNTWLAGPAATSLEGMVRTLVRHVGAILDKLRGGQIDEDEAVRWIEEILASPGRAQRIAVTEVNEAMNEAAQLVYLLQNSPGIRWVTMRDGKVCAMCQQNEATGAIPATDVFPSGDFQPPAHPFCRCRLVPAEGAPAPEGVGSVMKEEVTVTSDDWLKSAKTPELSTVHHPLGHEGLWHTPDRHTGERQQLPAYVQNIARALMREGHDESSAIAIAVAATRHWSAGEPSGAMRGKPHRETQAAGGRTQAEWERERAVHHTGKADSSGGAWFDAYGDEFDDPYAASDRQEHPPESGQEAASESRAMQTPQQAARGRKKRPRRAAKANQRNLVPFPKPVSNGPSWPSGVQGTWDYRPAGIENMWDATGAGRDLSASGMVAPALRAGATDGLRPPRPMEGAFGTLDGTKPPVIPANAEPDNDRTLSAAGYGSRRLRRNKAQNQNPWL